MRMSEKIANNNKSSPNMNHSLTSRRTDGSKNCKNINKHWILSKARTYRTNSELNETEDSSDQIKESPDDVVDNLQLAVVLIVRSQDVCRVAEVEHEEESAQDHRRPECEVEEALGQAARVLVDNAANDAAQLWGV